MKPLELPIKYYSAEQSQINNLGIRPNITDTKTRNVNFYNIDNIQPYEEDDIWMCSILSSGQEYICPYTYEKVKSLIEHNL